MSLSLSSEWVERYRKDGILHPVPVMPEDEANQLREKYLALAPDLKGRRGQKSYLLYTWINQLVRDPRILDRVESLLGPDLLCWSSSFFVKNGGDPGFVSWHQDATYWGLSSPDVLTAWVALSPSTIESGCLQVVPGTHHEQVRHEDTFDEKNMLSRGQEIAVKVEQDQIVNVELRPGEMSIHHVLLFHGSEPNRAKLPRIGFAIRYIPTHLKQLSPLRDSALLVRGRDDYHHFDLEQSPTADLTPEAIACHNQALDMQLKILYAGAQERGRLNPDRAATAM